MLANLLYFAGTFVMACLVSGMLLMALVLVMESSTARLLIANVGALIALELFYRIFDARFPFPRGELTYAAAQLACLGSQWLLMAPARKTPQQP